MVLTLDILELINLFDDRLAIIHFINDLMRLLGWQAFLELQIVGSKERILLVRIDHSGWFFGFVSSVTGFDLLREWFRLDRPQMITHRVTLRTDLVLVIVITFDSSGSASFAAKYFLLWVIDQLMFKCHHVHCGICLILPNIVWLLYYGSVLSGNQVVLRERCGHK